MSKLSKLIAALVATVALMAPLAIQPAANAHTPSHHSDHRVFWVYYRACPNSQWVCYGGYYDAGQAQQAINWFQYNGYDAYYR